MAEGAAVPDPSVLTVVDALPFKAALLDATVRPVHVNPPMREYLGMTPGADVTTAPDEYVHPDDRAASREVIGSLLAEESPSGRAEVRLRGIDGVYRWHICLASPMPGPAGTPSAWLATFVDIEDDRRREEDLRRAHAAAEELVALVETTQANAPIGFAFVDADLRFRHINDRLAEINGIPREEHLGRLVADVVPDLWPQLEPLYHRAMQGEMLVDLEVTGETGARPGVPRVWLASYYPVRRHGDGPVAGVGVIAREVSEQRRLEAQLAQSAKLQAVGQLAGGVAHDFNNVLATVMLTAEVLAHESDEAEIRAGLARILAAARSAAELTKQLLVFARRQPTNPVALDVPAAVDRVLDLVRGTISSSVVVDVAVGACPPVVMDPTHFEQVLVNLLVNARDAMPSGGRITISAVHDPAGTGLEGSPGPAGFVTLSVEDTGAGMTAEVRDRALEPFFTTKPLGTGTGLGLATVHGIVAGAGGSLHISSSPGAGTVVQVSLPAAEQVASPVGSEAPAARGGAGEHVLVVEDQDELRAVVARMLAASGYTVSVAASASAAEQLLSERPVDLLVTDVVMPQGTGPELAQRLRAGRPDLPVVFMSGYTGTVLDGYRLDDSAIVLTKPFSREVLLAAVASALDAVAAPDG